jgi:hypothetical protein
LNFLTYIWYTHDNELNTGFQEHALREVKARGPAWIFTVGCHHTTYARLYDYTGTAAARHEWPGIKRGTLQTLIGKYYGIDLAMYDHLVFDLALLQPEVGIFDTTRESIVSSADDATLIIHYHSAYFGAGVFAPAGYVLGQVKEPLVPIIHTAKLLPQPHLLVALGFRITKLAPERFSAKSTSLPCMYCRLMGSIKARTESNSITVSSSSV